MIDTVDAAFYYPSTEHAYFFKGPHYLKYSHDRGVVPLSGRVLRTIGVDGWTSLPALFRRDIDAAFFYPPNGHAYFFKGANYVKYRPDEGVVPLAGGELIRTIGVDGWESFPSAPTSFTSGIDAALFYPDNGHAYFFKGDRYIKYRPGSGVVSTRGRAIRTIGEDGWNSFPTAFRAGIDAATYYPPRGKVYFFRSRNYIRWEPGEGVDARYPRRIGLRHRDGGGWPGLSHVIAGPLIGPVTDRTAKIWIWMTDATSADRLEVMRNGSVVPFTSVGAVGSEIVADVDAIDGESTIRVLTLGDLSPSTNYDGRIKLGNVELDAVTFNTAPTPSSTGRLKIGFGSCSDMSKHADVPAFEGMNRVRPDLALFCGDNCYYVHADLATGPNGPRPRDWESTERMLSRQLEARNHPQFTNLSRSVPSFSTWDDHDFAYNNAHGSDLTDNWVGPNVAAAVFRAMWPNPYQSADADQSIFYSFRWGPVEVFMTDSRFARDPNAEAIWGATQLRWLVAGLEGSIAPIKIVVSSGQFLFTRDDNEGHPNEARRERSTVLDAVLGSGGAPSVTGRVLFLSGDIHYSELLRLPGTGPASTLELTSSPLRREISGNPPSEDEAGSRIWAAKQNGFGVVTVDVTPTAPNDRITGTVTLEVRDDHGDLIVVDGQTCRSTWNLSTGAVT